MDVLSGMLEGGGGGGGVCVWAERQWDVFGQDFTQVDPDFNLSGLINLIEV